jgi:hypothetical protein
MEETDPALPVLETLWQNPEKKPFGCSDILFLFPSSQEIVEPGKDYPDDKGIHNGIKRGHQNTADSPLSVVIPRIDGFDEFEQAFTVVGDEEIQKACRKNDESPHHTQRYSEAYDFYLHFSLLGDSLPIFSAQKTGLSNGLNRAYKRFSGGLHVLTAWTSTEMFHKIQKRTRRTKFSTKPTRDEKE